MFLSIYHSWFFSNVTSFHFLRPLPFFTLRLLSIGHLSLLPWSIHLANICLNSTNPHFWDMKNGFLTHFHVCQRVLHNFKSVRLCWLGDKYYFDTFPLCFVIIERRERNPISRHFPVASNKILVLQNPCRSDMKQWKCGDRRCLWANKAFVHLWRREALRIPEHWAGRSLTVLV